MLICIEFFHYIFVDISWLPYEFILSLYFRIPSVRGVDWKPVAPDQKEIDYLELASIDNINMKKRDTIGDINFWSSLPIQENDKLFWIYMNSVKAYSDILFI